MEATPIKESAPKKDDAARSKWIVPYLLSSTDSLFGNQSRQL